MSNRLSRAAITSVAALALATTSLAACSSSGGGQPDQSALVTKLKTDPQFSPILKKLPASKQDGVANCIAAAMKEGLTTQELNDFANGKKTAAQIKDNSAKAQAAGTKAEACVTKAAGTG